MPKAAVMCQRGKNVESSFPVTSKMRPPREAAPKHAIRINKETQETPFASMGWNPLTAATMLRRLVQYDTPSKTLIDRRNP